MVAALALALPLAAAAQKSPVGSEFQVNTFTSSLQTAPAVAASASGDFVVAWQSYQDGSNRGVFVQRFSSAGAPLASEFQVNTFTLFHQRSPSVAADADGDFVVVWWSQDQDGSAYGVFARRYSSAGAPVTGEFQVNAHTTGNQRVVSVAAADDGDFVIVFSGYDNQDGSLYGVFAHRFSSAGVALATEFQVNTYTPGFQRFPSVGASASGDFVVVWQSYLQDGSDEGVFARRFSSAGAALAAEFQVNTYTDNHQMYPSLAVDDDGDFVVAWRSSNQDGYSYGVFARRFSSAGVALGSEFQVSTYTTSSEEAATVAMGPAGDFIVAWQSSGLDGSLQSVSARRFSRTGVALTTVFQVNTYTPGQQGRPSAAIKANGDFVVAWNSFDQDGSNYGVFAQRFAALATLDVDGNLATEALTDGLLVLRFLFGFTGNTLTSGAIGAGCTRCDAAAIQPYLGGLGLTLDVDGNNAAGALTDGLLVLRRLFGFTGATLVTGAVGGGCSRCDAPAIEPYLAGLTD